MSDELYRQANESYRRRFVYHLGAEAGFFSEFNNMILAMIYCLGQEIQFRLYSADAPFVVSRGWSDYFLTFCPETANILHRLINRRQARQTGAAEAAVVGLAKRLLDTDYLTHELWSAFRADAMDVTRRYSTLGEVDVDVRRLAGVLVQMVWRYTPDCARAVDTLVRSLDLPSHYAAIHVRSGDKASEVPLYSVAEYVERLKQISPLKTVFLSTDNYDVFEEARRLYPDYIFRTLCHPSERGYSHGNLMRQTRGQRQAAMVNLLACVDVMVASERFVGTCNSNIGMFVGMRLANDRISYLDADRWFVW